MWDVLQILGINGKLPEELPFPFYLGQVSLAFMFLATLSDQAMLVEDASNRFMGTRQAVHSL